MVRADHMGMCWYKTPVMETSTPKLVREFKDIHIHTACHTERFEAGIHRRLSEVVFELRRRGVLD